MNARFWSDLLLYRKVRKHLGHHNFTCTHDPAIVGDAREVMLITNNRVVNPRIYGALYEVTSSPEGHADYVVVVSPELALP